MLDQFTKDCILWEEPHSTGDEGIREGVAAKKRYRLTINTGHLHCWGSEGGRGRLWGEGAFGCFPSFLASVGCVVISNKSYDLPMLSVFCLS